MKGGGTFGAEVAAEGASLQDASVFDAKLPGVALGFTPGCLRRLFQSRSGYRIL